MDILKLDTEEKYYKRRYPDDQKINKRGPPI